MVAARLPALAVHALLHDRPLAVVGDEKTVQIEVEAVLHGGAVDLRHKPACARQRLAIEADALAQRRELVGRAARVFSAPAADMDAELALQRRQPAFERPDDARGDAGGMPVHPHDGAEGLEPERMRQPPQKFIAPVMMDDGLAHDGAQRGHALGQPLWNPSAVKRQIGAACASCHSDSNPVANPLLAETGEPDARPSDGGGMRLRLGTM